MWWQVQVQVQDVSQPAQVLGRRGDAHLQAAASLCAMMTVDKEAACILERFGVIQSQQH